MKEVEDSASDTGTVQQRHSRKSLIATGAALMLGASGAIHAGVPLDVPGFLDIPRPAPTLQLDYGRAPSQGIDVFLPMGEGPHPVVVLIHGGCWSERTAAREQLRHIGADLAAHGIATWSIGYRRANEKGGGYPNTFLDVGAAVDRLRSEASHYRFDLSRVLLVGHSAGGHLALWAASRHQLPASSPLWTESPFVPRKVISIAGIGDLKTYAPQIAPICGPGVGENLVGPPTKERVDVYSDTSPAALAPQGADIVMVSGILDRLVPPYVAHDYARLVRTSSRVTRVNIEDAGHFDLVATTRPAWVEIRQLILDSISP